MLRPDEKNGGYKSVSHAVDPARYLMTTKTTEGGLIEQELNFEKFAYKNPADKSSHQA